MPSATGESARQIQPRRVVTRTNAAEAPTTSATAAPVVIAPRGNSRFAVLGLSASNRASTSRLNPIAAVRAVTIAATIHRTRGHVTGVCCAASNAPTRANGSANTE